MPFVPLPNGLQIELLHTLFERPVECTFTFVERPFGGPAIVENAATAAFFYWITHILPYLSRDLQLVGVAATDVSVSGGERLLIPLATPIAGGFTAGALPANVTVRVNYQVAYPPGGRRGCMFLPGIPSDQVTNNRIDLSWRAAITEQASYLIDLAELNGWRWVVASKWLAGSLRAVAVPMRVDITSVDSLYVGQRRGRLHNEPYT